QLHWAFRTLLGERMLPPGGQAGSLTTFQPLSWWFIDLQVLLFGPGPVGIHLVNLLFHALNGVLLYFVTLVVLRRIMPEIDVRALAASAGLATAVFALHPLRAEVVGWASAQPYLPCTCLTLLTILAYLRAFDSYRPRRLWYCVSLGCFLLSLLAKPLVV